MIVCNYYMFTLLENIHFTSRFSPQAMAYLMWTITRWQHCNYCEFYKGFSHQWEKYLREKSTWWQFRYFVELDSTSVTYYMKGKPFTQLIFLLRFSLSENAIHFSLSHIIPNLSQTLSQIQNPPFRFSITELRLEIQIT